MTDNLMALLWLLGAILLLWERLSKLRNDKKSTDGDVAEKVSEAWERLNKPLQEQVDLLTKQARQERILLREYIRGTRILTMQLEDNLITPNWFPPNEYVEIAEDAKTEPILGKKKDNHGGFGGWKH